MQALLRTSVVALTALWLSVSFAFAVDNNFPTPGGATADGKVVMCVNGGGFAVPCGNATTPFQVAGSFSATLSGFTPGGTFATLTAGAASASVALPAGTTVFFQNAGTTTVSCTLGIGSAVATASEILVPAGSGVPVVVGSNTFGACIDQTGSASNLVVLAGGSGLATPFGGGGGGGGGGAVTVADGADVALGALADAAASAGGTGSLSAKLRLMTTQLAAATISGSTTNPTSTLTLPPVITTAYTAGQLVCTNATAGTCNTAIAATSFFLIANAAGGASISRLRLSTNDTTSTAWAGQTVQIDLWTAAPTFTNGDRGTWLPATGSASHLATFTCTFPSPVWGDGLATECQLAVGTGNAANPKLGSGTSIFWSLNALTGSGITGASKVFTLAAEVGN